MKVCCVLPGAIRLVSEPKFIKIIKLCSVPDQHLKSFVIFFLGYLSGGRCNCLLVLQSSLKCHPQCQVKSPRNTLFTTGFIFIQQSCSPGQISLHSEFQTYYFNNFLLTSKQVECYSSSSAKVSLIKPATRWNLLCLSFCYKSSLSQVQWGFGKRGLRVKWFQAKYEQIQIDL